MKIRHIGRALPREAVDNSTAESLRAFLDIHEALSQLVACDHIRTRYIGSEGHLQEDMDSRTIGVQSSIVLVTLRFRQYCYRQNTDIAEQLEAYFSGHASAPVPGANLVPGRRAGHPVFHVICNPTPQFVRQTIDVFSRRDPLSPAPLSRISSGHAPCRLMLSLSNQLSGLSHERRVAIFRNQPRESRGLGASRRHWRGRLRCLDSATLGLRSAGNNSGGGITRPLTPFDGLRACPCESRG